MSDELTREEQLIREIRELTDTVKEHADDRATIDLEKLTEEFADLAAARTKEQIEDVLAKAPVRRVPGDAIGTDDDGATVTKENRYYPMVKDWRDGRPHDYGFGVKMQPLDLFIAAKMLEGQNLKKLKR